MEAQADRPIAAQNKTIAILLIDDEPDVLSIFKKSLELEGYSTYGFVNPTAAVEHFRQNPKGYQIVITDVRMPGMSGFQVVREIKKLNPDVKIIMTSAFEINMKEMKAVLPSTEIDGIIKKPAQLQNLIDLVKVL